MKNDAIIVFSSNVENWGAERSVCSMCDYLHRQGLSVLVIIPREGTIINLLDSIHVEYLILPFDLWIYSNIRSLRPDRYLKKIFNIIKSTKCIEKEILNSGYKPILVYSSTILFGTGLYCAKKWKVPHIHHFRENIDAFGYRFIFGNKPTMNYIRKNTDCIICTCDAVKQRYSDCLSDVEMKVVNNGVPALPNISKKNIGDKIKIIQVARFMDDKRIIDSLKAIHILIKRGYTNIKFDIYGKGPEEAIYKKYIDDNNLSNYIEIVGFKQNIDFSLYNIGLMTSTFEAFARTTLDYMNNGLAVVASNSGGNIEQVVDRETGLLFEVHNSNALADCLTELYNSPELITEYGNAGRKRFLQKFTQSIYQNKIGKIIMSYI